MADEFGNRLRCWYSLDEVDKSYTGLVGVRYQIPGSPFCRYDLTLDQARDTVAEFVSKGADPSLITIGEAAPDQYVTVNAEIIQSTHSIDMHYSRYKGQMRTALAKAPEYAEGARAIALLRYFCDPSSYEEIQLLLDRYPNHAVEFSCYTRNVGCIPNRNTLIWEVRRY